jgi:hypothetical protein
MNRSLFFSLEGVCRLEVVVLREVMGAVSKLKVGVAEGL